MILLVWKKKLKFISWKKTDSQDLTKQGALTAGGLRAAQGPQKLWDKWCKILHSGSLLALRLKARKHYIYIMNLRKKLSVDKRHPLLKFTGSSHFRVIRAPNLCIVAMQLFSKVLLKAFPPAAGIVYVFIAKFTISMAPCLDLPYKSAN